MKKIKLVGLFICLGFFSLGQMTDYVYKRKINGIEDKWHRLEIPDEVYGRLQSPLNDIRVYGVTESKDTIESAYLLDVQRTERIVDSRPYELLNRVHNSRGYYYTLRLEKDVDINQIDLSFDRYNYDWEITVEGSHDLDDWFIIAEDARVISIRDTYMDYRYNRVRFPRSRYRYYRIYLPVRVNPRLILPNVVFTKVVDGKTRTYSIDEQKVSELRNEKETVIDLTLKHAAPVHKIKVNTNSDFDYYRRAHVEYLSDSIKTEKGWKYVYEDMGHGVLTSLEDDELELSGQIAKRLRVTIENRDNQPLEIGKIEVKGYIHELVTRFTEKADYYLVYGKKNANYPDYDIYNFADKIPDSLTNLAVGKEVVVSTQEEEQAETPLIESRWWLWGLMIVVIISLGAFTLKMMRSDQHTEE